MNKILIVLTIIGIFVYVKKHNADNGESNINSLLSDSKSKIASIANYRCDGRTHCSQMTSCDEAIYFLKSCPNTEMDGDSDGIPCERQWCS